MTIPFYTKNNQIVAGFNIAALYDKRIVKGDIGLEIEVEGNKFQKEDIPNPWTYHKDNSLRGADNAEYVLKGPIPFDRVPEAIDILWQMFANYGSVLDESNRTSVHVHLNVQKLHLNRLTAFFALYFSVEELLTEWCGDHRVGNLFCLRAKDATAIVSHIKKFIQYGHRYEFRDGMHYAGLNVGALEKFGSVEIRTLRGVNDPNTILDWISILQRIYELSAEFPDPRSIPSLLSSEGPLNYLEMVLGDKTALIRNGIDYTIEQTREALYNGIRLAQDLCYCRDWSLYKPTDISSDPFGRHKKKSTLEAVYAQSLMNMTPVQTIPLTTAAAYAQVAQDDETHATDFTIDALEAGSEDEPFDDEGEDEE